MLPPIPDGMALLGPMTSLVWAKIDRPGRKQKRQQAKAPKACSAGKIYIQKNASTEQTSQEPRTFYWKSLFKLRLFRFAKICWGSASRSASALLTGRLLSRERLAAACTSSLCSLPEADFLHVTTAVCSLLQFFSIGGQLCKTRQLTFLPKRQRLLL